MRIADIAVRPIHIPFRTAFRHASARYRGTQGVLVEVQTVDGVRGYGEGCPRSFVTGESVEGAVHFVRQYAGSIVRDIVDLQSLRVWKSRHQSDIAVNPAAWCAIELALLDAIGRTHGESLEVLLGIPPLSSCFNYSAVLGDASWPVFLWQFFSYRRAGFEDFKIKLSGIGSRDRQKVRTFRGKKNLRVLGDANNLWPDADACLRALALLDCDWFALEEPVVAGDLVAARAVGRELQVPIILDESFTDQHVLPLLSEDPERWILNLRVSKLGGLLNTLDIAHKAQKLGLKVIVGAHVGETSLLTRAALTVAGSIANGPVAQEGAFGTKLLRYDLTDKPLMFGVGGMLQPGKLGSRAGSGLSIKDASA